MIAGAPVAPDHDIAPTGLGTGAAFAGFCAGLRFDDLPPAVVAEAKRGVLDWFGCALAGSRHPTVDRLIAGLDRMHSAQIVPVVGRGRCLGMIGAALANGQIGHVLDFDDTHMDVFVLHTSSPALGGLISAAYAQPCSGRDFLLSYVLAFEAGIRLGRTAPLHHEGGWHLTGTLGSIAAGIACARLLGLDERQMLNALGLAATQSAGLKQNRGTMAKSFHAGHAAAAGLTSAMLASAGLEASSEIAEGRRGFAATFSTGPAKHEALIHDLGRDWKILRNGYKPYACGVVMHPLIDAMVRLGEAGVDPARVERIELVVHPLVLRVTGVKAPATGIESKFSLYHAAAVAFLDGRAGIAQFCNERAADPAVIALRGA